MTIPAASGDLALGIDAVDLRQAQGVLIVGMDGHPLVIRHSTAPGCLVGARSASSRT